MGLQYVTSQQYLRVAVSMQHYNMRKRSEHAFKSILMDSRQISCASPKSYAHRFCKFMGELFVARGNR